jgi:MFS family permease
MDPTVFAATLSNRQRSLIAVIASMVVVNLVYGLTLPLLSLVLDAQGVSKTMNGLSIVAQACAGVIIAPFTPRLLMRIGAARAMQLATAVAAIMLLALGTTQDVYTWFPLRFLRLSLVAFLAIQMPAGEPVWRSLSVSDRWHLLQRGAQWLPFFVWW